MTKTMAEVLDELDAHRPDRREYEGGWWELACAGCDFAKGERLSHLDWAPYRVHRAEVFAAALSAAGFGLVADAKAEAWDECEQAKYEIRITDDGKSWEPVKVNPYQGDTR